MGIEKLTSRIGKQNNGNMTQKICQDLLSFIWEKNNGLKRYFKSMTNRPPARFRDKSRCQKKTAIWPKPKTIRNDTKRQLAGAPHHTHRCVLLNTFHQCQEAALLFFSLCLGGSSHLVKKWVIHDLPSGNLT